MANGTTDEKIARADRIQEQSLKSQTAADQSRKATQNAIANLRRAMGSPGSEPYREEMDSVSEVTLGPKGFHGKSIPKWAMGVIGIAIALAILAIGLAAVVRLVR